MKTKLVFLVALLFITSCNSLSSSPSTVVRRFIANSESGDVNADAATVSFFYGDREKNDSVHLNFSLVKENGEWKIYDVGPAQ